MQNYVILWCVRLVISLFCNPAIVVLIMALATFFVHTYLCGSSLAAYELLAQYLVLIYVTIHLKGQRKGGELFCSVLLWDIRALLVDAGVELL